MVVTCAHYYVIRRYMPRLRKTTRKHTAPSRVGSDVLLRSIFTLSFLTIAKHVTSRMFITACKAVNYRVILTQLVTF